jgi:release factor glutamine methyltransferase
MMLTVRLRDEINRAAALLAQAGVASPRVDAEELAAHAAGVGRAQLFTLDAPDGEFACRYAELVAARARRIPLQHLLGTAAFGSLTLEVGPGVFIPRPETESLLDWAQRQALPRTPLIVDLCTGSGALAVALATRWPQARVVAVDNSDEALGYARRNSVGTGVEVHRADVTDVGLLPGLDGRVDLLVANPPYIPDLTPLEPEVAEHDPRDALFGGPDGMNIIAAVAGHAVRWLRPGGLVAIEHDDTTAAAAIEMLSGTGELVEVSGHTDLAGRPRFVTARRAS